MVPEHVKTMFCLQGPAVQLHGGSRPAYQFGRVVVKQLHARSLETEHSLKLAPWLAGELASIEEKGFRFSRPIMAQNANWLLEDGWAAWTFVEGRPACGEDAPQVIEAMRALHQALEHIPKHPLLDQNTTAWGVAHRHCWADRPERVHPVLAGLVDELYARYKPLPLLPCQLIHGDLNADNICVLAGQPPGFIDFTPFWAPVDFAIVFPAIDFTMHGQTCALCPLTFMGVGDRMEKSRTSLRFKK